MGKKLNLDNPKDLNEWVLFLSLCTKHPQWSLYADKFRVRDYVASKGFGDMLVPLLEYWDDAKDFSLEKLPDCFVLKFNGGGDSTSVILVDDKSKFKEPELKSTIKQWMHTSYGIDSAEPHYRKIPPVVIAEKLLDCKKQSITSSSLIDYKVFCIFGEPQYIFCYTNRKNHTYNLQLFDTEWHDKSEFIVYNYMCFPPIEDTPQPKNLNRIFDACRKLSKDEPFCRIDFYEVDNKPYFGEMTMVSYAGRFNLVKQSWLDEMGRRIADAYNKKIS